MFQLLPAWNSSMKCFGGRDRQQQPDWPPDFRQRKAVDTEMKTQLSCVNFSSFYGIGKDNSKLQHSIFKKSKTFLAYACMWLQIYLYEPSNSEFEAGKGKNNFNLTKKIVSI